MVQGMQYIVGNRQLRIVCNKVERNTSFIRIINRVGRYTFGNAYDKRSWTIYPKRSRDVSRNGTSQSDIGAIEGAGSRNDKGECPGLSACRCDAKML